MTVTARSVNGNQPTRHAQRAGGICASLSCPYGAGIWTRRGTMPKVAVAEMLSAFADIGPHLDMTVRQSTQINATLLTSEDGPPGPIGAGMRRPSAAPHTQSRCRRCDRRAPRAGDHPPHHRTLERIAKPFRPRMPGLLVSQQVERMYVGFQYQDRISQMMALLFDDMQRLQQVLAAPGPDATAPPAAWMAQLESRYAMAAQRSAHAGAISAQAGDQETDFFERMIDGANDSRD